MREIEFRGKRLGSGEWVYGDLIVLTMGAEGKPIDPIACIRIESGLSFEDEVNPVDLKTVGQYTGLKDKNGNKIYEGDIVKVYDGFKERTFTGVVEFRNASFMINEEDFIEHYRWIDYRCEVIGNIHENPELVVADNA